MYIYVSVIAVSDNAGFIVHMQLCIFQDIDACDDMTLLSNLYGVNLHYIIMYIFNLAI